MGLARDIGPVILQVGEMEGALRICRDALGFAIKGRVDPVWSVVTTEGGSLTVNRVKAPVPCVRSDGGSAFNMHVANFD